MCTLAAGDRFWVIGVRRLVIRYGDQITIIHGEAPVMGNSFAVARDDVLLVRSTNQRSIGGEEAPSRTLSTAETLCNALGLTLIVKPDSNRKAGNGLRPDEAVSTRRARLGGAGEPGLDLAWLAGET
jgi:hypothetical protein